MKYTISVIIIFLNHSFSLSQIPNAEFEEWITNNNIESPLYWETNNFYTASTPADKELNAIQGKYSLKLSSIALSKFGTYTEPACAHVKFIPTKFFNYLNFSIKIDSIYYGQISVRIKQLGASGLYERIGGWNSSNKTSGIESINIPISQTTLDTMLIEIWALKTDDLLNGIIGYSEAIFDLFSLSSEPNSLSNFAFDSEWKLFYYFNNKLLSIENNSSSKSPLKLNVIDTQGKLVKIFNLSKNGLNVYDLESLSYGLYFITISDNQNILYSKKIIL